RADFLFSLSWRVSQPTGHCHTRTTMNEPKADAKAIFLAALDCEGAEALSRFLDTACGADAALRQRGEELLQANRDARGLSGRAVFWAVPTDPRPRLMSPQPRPPARLSAPTSCSNKSAKAVWARFGWPSRPSRSNVSWP